jgi:hypothetical protein
VQTHVPVPRTLVVPLECITTSMMSDVVPVNVPERAAERVAVMNVFPSAVRVSVVVVVTTANVPVTGEGGLAVAGTATRTAAAVTARNRNLRISP